MEKALVKESKWKGCTGWRRTQAITVRDCLFRLALCRKRNLRLLEARTVGGLRRKARFFRTLELVGSGELACCCRGSKLLETRSVGKRVLRRKARLLGIGGKVGSGKLFASRGSFFRSYACPGSLNKIESGKGFGPDRALTTHRMLDLRSPFLLPRLSCHLQFVQHRLKYAHNAVQSARVQSREPGVPRLRRQFGCVRE